MAANFEEKVLSELNLTATSLDQQVQHIIEWLKAQPHLPNIRDEKLLKAFIIGCESAEKAKEKLDKYFTARTKNPELFSNRDPKTIKWDSVEKLMVLPGTTPEGYHVLFLKEPSVKEEIESFDFVETARAGFMLLDAVLRSSPINAGQILVVDCSTSSELLVKFVTSHTPAIFNTYQHAMPIRMRELICINASSFVETFCNNVLKLFFSEELQEKIFVYSGDHTVLSKHFPQEMLPQEYGGTSPPIDKLFEETKAKIEKERDWLMTDGIKGADESVRPKTENQTEELQGKFTKLEID